MRAAWNRLIADRSAASAAEYAIVMALMGAATFAGISLLSGAVSGTFSDAILLFSLTNP